jgi:hypothetical protein
MIGQPKFVTVDDFKNYWGIDLRERLRSDDNTSNQAERFLARVEDRLMNWIDNNTFRRLKYDELKFKPRLYENWQKAILTQAMYMYKNGDLGIDSGYDAEKGIVTARSDLVELEVSQATIDYLSNAGLFNLNVRNLPRTGKILYGFSEVVGPDIPPVYNGPTISDMIIFYVRGAQFINLNQNHYLELTNNINLPDDFFRKDEYLVNINLNNEVKQVRFMTNQSDMEKYGIILYEYGGATYEYVIYISRSGPTVRIRSAVVTMGEGA